eukprot:scaffold36539_cov188-Isochrysis_galbana.AAC.4
MGHMLCGLSPKASAKASTKRIVFTAPKRRSPLAADFDRIACAMIASPCAVGSHDAEGPRRASRAQLGRMGRRSSTALSARALALSVKSKPRPDGLRIRRALHAALACLRAARTRSSTTAGGAPGAVLASLEGRDWRETINKPPTSVECGNTLEGAGTRTAARWLGAATTGVGRRERACSLGSSSLFLFPACTAAPCDAPSVVGTPPEAQDGNDAAPLAAARAMAARPWTGATKALMAGALRERLPTG